MYKRHKSRNNTRNIQNIPDLHDLDLEKLNHFYNLEETLS